MSDEPLILICLPVSAPTTPVLGNLNARCARCAMLVWVSPSSLPVLHLATILCPTCGEREARTAKQHGEPYQFGGFLPGQLDELRDDAGERP